MLRRKPDLKHDIKGEVTRYSAEHEVFLVFNSDEGAELFERWWNDRGWSYFEDWVDENPQEWPNGD